MVSVLILQLAGRRTDPTSESGARLRSSAPLQKLFAEMRQRAFADSLSFHKKDYSSDIIYFGFQKVTANVVNLTRCRSVQGFLFSTLTRLYMLLIGTHKVESFKFTIISALISSIEKFLD